MTRPGSVTASAVIAFAGSALVLLVAVLMVVGALTLQGEQRPLRGVVVGMAVFAGALSALGIATGLGLLRMKAWARISTLIFAGFMAVMSFSAMVLLATVPLPPQPGMTASMATATRWAMVAGYAVPTAIGIWWLVLFNTRTIKAAFASGVAPTGASTRPTSISIIGWWSLVGGLLMLIPALVGMPAFFAGATLVGWSARLLYVLMGGIAAYIGWELLKLRERGRILAIAWYAFGAAHTAFTFLVPSVRQRVLEFQESMRPEPSPAVPGFDPMPFMLWILVFTIALIGIATWFLIRNKPAFKRVGAAA
jgi:hypothetical protein